MSESRHSREFLRAVLALALVAATASLACGRGPGRPNVVMIVIDTLRWDHLGLTGYTRNTSPAIDRLAEDSLLFTRAVSSAPWTPPSMAALLTGRHPAELGYAEARRAPNLPVLEPDFVMLPEALRANGYRTAAFVSHHMFGSAFGFDQGFDVFDEEDAQGHGHVSSPSLLEKAVRWLDANGEEPFFLLVHFFDPHYDYVLHPQYPFDLDRGRLGSYATIERLLEAAPTMTDADLSAVVSLYDSEIRFTDAHIGRLLDRLRETNRYDPALIVVVADHGEEFMDRGTYWIGHSRTLYEELVHVPLLIKLPGSIGAGRVEQTVGLIDLVPSLVAYLELDVPQEARDRLRGRVLPLGDVQKWQDLAPAPQFSETRFVGLWLQSVTLDRSKLIVDRIADSLALFDLAADPGERTDLAASRPDEVRALSEILERWDASVRSDEGGAVQSREAELSEQQREDLRTLGYTE